MIVFSDGSRLRKWKTPIFVGRHVKAPGGAANTAKGETRRPDNFNHCPNRPRPEASKGDRMKLYNSPPSQITRFTACAILALFASAVSHPVFAQAHQAKFNGSFTDGVACGSDGLCSGVTIGRNGAGSAAETFLSFFSNRFDPVAGIFTNDFGIGIIPNEDLAGD